MKKPLGIILYDGPSKIDKKPIVVVATGFQRRSRNKKLGQMIQCWIIRSDIHPFEALKTGDDYSVCGDCKHSSKALKTCYVNVMHGPASVYRTYKNGKYSTFSPDLLHFFKNRYIRLGSYGDPTAVPISIWKKICKIANGFTGYSHLWEKCSTIYKQFCMASVDNIIEYTKACLKGWKTFRVRLPNEPLLPKEFVCPGSVEGGKKSSCEKCNSCKGGDYNNLRTPCIVVHGVRSKRYIKAIEFARN